MQQNDDSKEEKFHFFAYLKKGKMLAVIAFAALKNISLGYKT